LGVPADGYVVAEQVAGDVDGVTDGDDVVGEVALQAALLPVRRAEVDDPGIDAEFVEHGDATGVGCHVEHPGIQHHRRHQQHRRPRGVRGGLREIATQPEVAAFGDHLVGSRFLLGLQAAEAQHFQAVLHRGAEPPSGTISAPTGFIR